MGDPFHADVPTEFLARMFAVMAATPQHTYQLLTKRHARMRSVLNDAGFRAQVASEYAALLEDSDTAHDWMAFAADAWPLKNVELGVSVESQKWAGIRIPELLRTPAAVRFISAEPLLGPIDLVGRGWLFEPCGCCVPGFPGRACFEEPGSLALDWVIVGGESGAGARPMHPYWVRNLRNQCEETGTAFFFKQWGEWAPAEWKGEDGATHAFTGGSYVEDGEIVDTFMRLGHAPTSTERDAVTPRGAQGMRRLGTKTNGCTLDERIHHGYPEVRV
jgi:protein gp37